MANHQGITGVVVGQAMMMGRTVEEWSEILDYARETGWRPTSESAAGEILRREEFEIVAGVPDEPSSPCVAVG